jgi:hypothetical protein
MKRVAAAATGTGEANDLEIPSRPLNGALREIFRIERRILPRASLPIGLSLLCLARKGGSA